jgi:cytochrome c oxidase subunit II
VDHLLDQEKLDELASFESPVLAGFDGLNRLVVSSTDVLHSLGLPSAGVKLDSVPGRLNTTVMERSLGLMVGSCYELCGRGHRAIPIFFLFC